MIGVMPPFRTVAALSSLLLALPCAAFSDKVHQDVAEQAGRLMPASLRGILSKELPALRAGASAPLPVNEDGLFLYPDGTYGTLDQTVERQARRVLDLLQQRAPMESVVREMGVLSRAVALASDPVHVVPHDARTADWSAEFERFLEARQPRFKVAFFGYGSPELDRGDVPGFVRSCAERSRRCGPLLGQMFVKEDGTIAKGSGFDDKHPVFGIASLAYTHAITDTARAWLYVWIRANGDTTGVPFPQALPQGSASLSP